jgi:hypothetical protein
MTTNKDALKMDHKRFYFNVFWQFLVPCSLSEF